MTAGPNRPAFPRNGCGGLIKLLSLLSQAQVCEQGFVHAQPLVYCPLWEVDGGFLSHDSLRIGCGGAQVVG